MKIHLGKNSVLKKNSYLKTKRMTYACRPCQKEYYSQNELYDHITSDDCKIFQPQLNIVDCVEGSDFRPSVLFDFCKLLKVFQPSFVVMNELKESIIGSIHIPKSEEGNVNINDIKNWFNGSSKETCKVVVCNKIVF